MAGTRPQRAVKRGAMNAFEMLQPTFSQGDGYTLGSVQRHLAVIVLRPIETLSHDELNTALCLHGAIGRGLLVVV